MPRPLHVSDSASILKGRQPVAPRGIRQIFNAAEVRTVTAPQLLAEGGQAEIDRQVELGRLVELARAEGHAAGVAAALAEGQASVHRAADALDRLAESAETAAIVEVAAASTLMIETALQISEWLVRRELSDDGKTLLSRLETGLTALLPSPTTRISVSPADHPLVSEWAAGRGRVGTVVVADQRLAPGDAVVTTDAGRAEITVAAALHTAAEALGLTTLPGEL